MGSVDRAFESPTPVWLPPELRAIWRPAVGYEGPASPDNLSEQLGPEFTVNQTFDDGMPDPVTATSQADAGGKLSVPALTGRSAKFLGPFEGTNFLAHYGIGTPRTENSGTGIDLGVNVQNPAYTVHDLKQVMIVTWRNFTDPVDFDPEDNALLDSISNGWQPLLITHHNDKVAIAIYERTVPVGVDDGYYNYIGWLDNVQYAIQTFCVFANTFEWERIAVSVSASSLMNTTASTSHTTPPVTLYNRGYVVGIFVGQDVTFTPDAGVVELAETTTNHAARPDISLAVMRTPLVDSLGVPLTVSATSSGVPTFGFVIALAFSFLETPAMTAKQYFSPFNSQSPIVEYERDIAPVQLDFGVLTDSQGDVFDTDGPFYTRIFTGQMSSLRVRGEVASMEAISAVRLKMMKSVQPPLVSGTREGGNMSWLAGWTVAHAADQFASPGPTEYTRWWAPMHGSLHSWFNDPTYDEDNYGIRYDAAGTNALYRPRDIPGPYVLGMYAEEAPTQAVENRWASALAKRSQGRWGEFETPFGTMQDLMSVGNHVGRWSGWIRCDVHTTSHAQYAVDPATADYLMSWIYYQRHPSGLVENFVGVRIRASDRQLGITYQDDDSSSAFIGSGVFLPSDGNWHFVGFTWNWNPQNARVVIDTTETQFALSGMNVAHLSSTEELWESTGGYYDCAMWARLPLAEVMVEASAQLWSTPVPYRNTIGFSPTFITRPLTTQLEAVAEPVARDAWSILVDIAQASLCMYRADEFDMINLLPLSYFGEAAQLTPGESLNTEVNAANLDVVTDPSKVRNRVTVEFTETRVDDTWSFVLQSKTVEELPVGTIQRTYALDVPVTQLRNIYSNFNNITGPSGTPPNNGNFITVNQKSDGTGTYHTNNTFNGAYARIVSYDSQSVTIEFTNRTGAKRYLANNVDDYPVLAVMGYAIRSATGYETRSDDASIAQRGERTLSVELPFIQRRYDAGQMASLLTALLARPRHEVAVTVMGDPRRVPGSLVTISDAQGTAAAGEWRIMGIAHTRNNATYVHDVSLVQITPAANWDESPGWDLGAWGE